MILKKLTLAAAVAAGFAAPAFAQSNVQVYGKLYPYLLDERGSGATAAGTPVSTLAGTPTGDSGVGHTRGMLAGNSRLGFRGSEDLGGGLRANFQLEGVVSVDSGTGAGPSGGFIFNRNTFVGLSGGFGSVKLGNLDTVFKEYGDTLGILGLSSGTFMSSSDVLRKTGFGTSSASSFHLRRQNSVQYESPEIADFQFGYQYSTDEVAEGPRKPRLQSFGVRYDAGPIYVALAHEIHWDFFGGSRNAPSGLRNNATGSGSHSKDQATQLAVEYRFNKQHSVEFDAIRKTYREDPIAAGRFSSYRNMAYLLAMDSRWTPQWRTALQFVRATAGKCERGGGAVCSTDGLEGTKYTAAVGYSLSKRTMLFAAASLIKNGKSARFDNSELNGPPNPGEDISHFAIGISHNF